MTNNAPIGCRLALVTGAALLCGAVAPALAATSASIEPRILTEQGLALGMAFSMLQVGEDVAGYFNTTPPACAKQYFGGSVKTVSTTKVSSTVYKTKITIYFDAACKTPYINTAATVTISARGYTISQTAAYLGLHGQALGTFKVNEAFTSGKTTDVLSGLGSFKPAGAAPAASIGMVCSFPNSSTNKLADCQAGVEKTFGALNLSLASVTPLTLMAANTGSYPPITLSSSTSSLRTGPAGKLALTMPTASSLAISGPATNFGASAAAGAEAKFTLFPPMPTHWTFTDKAHDTQFSLSIISNSTRAAHATVKRVSTGAQLAAVTLDQSGSGTVHYGDGKTSVVQSWIPAD